MMKKIIYSVMCIIISVVLLTGCDVKFESNNPKSVALITMDSVDRHWISLKDAASQTADELGINLKFMAPNVKNNSQQIEQINNAVVAGCKVIIISANGPDAVSPALKEAISSGVKLIYVDSPANIDAEATFSTDNYAAGKTAGETMLEALGKKGVKSGKIGIVNVNAAVESCVQREKGFHDALKGSPFEILETQYCDGDSSKAQTLAENYITQGVVAVFGTNEGSTTGCGNAVKASKKDIVCVGFDKSDTIQNLINDGYIYAAIAQKPDVMGIEAIKAADELLKGKSLGGKVTDTGVSVLKKQ